MPGKNGWSCSQCTFSHSAPANRCSMCNALRVSKQQMVDFIQGIPIFPKDNNSNKNKKNDNNASSSSSSSPVDVVVAKKQAKRQRRTEQTTLLDNVIMENIGSDDDDGGGGNHETADCTQSKTAAAAAAAVDDSATQPPADASVTANGGGGGSGGSGGDGTQQNNTLLATFPPPKRQQQQQPKLLPPPPVPQKQQQQQQKRRAQRQEQHQQQHHRTSSLALSLPFSPGPVPFHHDTARDWIFPLCSAGFSKRQYQLDICATAVRHNTLVSLPTGLGKTLIAAVVLYNYHRWFPKGKVIFMATTLPLVQQQVQACYNVMGISVHDTAVLTGKMSPSRRIEIWNQKSVFFCTPQTVQKDLECHRLDASKIVCLVLDEAHRATGDFAYCKIVNHLFNINNNNSTSSTDTENNNNSNSNNSNAADTTTAAGEMKKNASAPAPAPPRFRLLGLSATPGSTIKKIQQVVDALRINKVEARNDDDPDVKKYIHERQYEVIVVPQVSACRDVERLLGELIGPMLDQLRNRGGFHERGGHATVLAYSVFNAKNVYVAKHGPNTDPLGILPLFFAVDPLLRIRSDLHQQGIGVVRHKLLKLKNEPQRGLLKNLVRGPAFAALWDLVERSTTCSSSNAVSSNNISTSIADKLMNNPKLVKLREILTVHFEQARATGQSSRAIVFAQFRDCVAEIVFVLGQDLAPLIRSRYFVGQGKGSSENNNNINNRTDAAAIAQQHQVKGMTQAEQHEAIRQFRDNVFNVLVCTCIGEEGLDIGEVDLIVNFDSIKSPIRSIQRVGRTGRKRDGRVVWLVSEGEEERTFRAGEQAKRTLVHALRNPNSFRVIPTIPMLPNDPVFCERGMNVSANAHMSQVEGHVEQKKTTTKRQQPPRRQSSNAGAGVTTTNTASSATTTTRRKSWRLSNDVQARRASVLGMSNRISTYSIPAMKRRIILARRQQHHHQQSTSRSSRATLGHSCRLGRTASLLCQFEENNNSMQDAATVSENSRHRVAGSGRSSDWSLDAFFPLTSSEEGFTKLAWGSLKAPPPPNSTTAAAPIIAPTSTSNNDSSCHYAKVVLPTAAPKTSENATRSCEEAALAVSHGGVAAREEPSQMTTTRPQPLVVVNPYTSRIIPTTKQRVPDHCVMEMSNLAGGTNNGFSSSSMLPVPEEFQLPTPEPSSGEESADDDDDDAPCVDFALGTAVLETNALNHCAAPNTTSDIVELNHRSIGHVFESVGFPPRDASLNELNHHPPETFAGQGGGIEQLLDEVTATVPLPAATKGAAPAPEASELNHASESESFGLDVARETLNEDDAFSLPPQDSSSSDDSDDDEDDNTNLSTLRAPKENTSVETAVAAEHPRVRFSLDNSTAFTADSCNRHSLEPDPDEGTENVHVRRRGRKTRTILDTPDSMSFTETSAVRQPSKPEVRLSLDTTFTSDSSNYHSLEPDLDESAEFLHVRRQGRKTRTIVDTPDTIISHKVEKVERSSVGSFENPAALLDTQESARKEYVPAAEIDDIVCAICRSGASPDEDPIVLCDGSGGSTAVCDLAVHATCYSATIDFNKAWRCDVCLYRFNGGTNQVRCLVCSKHTGALKRLDGDDWIHSDCRNGDPLNTTTAAASSKPRLKKIGRTIDVATREKQETGKKRTALSDVPVNVKKPAIAANKKKQRRDYCRFLDDEASIASGADIDGDEDEDDLLAIEGEEGKHDSFINDSSQLGEYTDDELDKVDSNDLHGDVDEDDEEDATHRAVDAERERMNAFATPLLNRRQKQQSTDSSSASVPSSERGLGKLHFIRSVMEHHRQGGRAEDIEQLFEELADGEEETHDVDNDY